MADAQPQSALSAEMIQVGRVYSAKRPERVGFLPPLWNDRQVKWIDSQGTKLQYDSPTVANGRRFPVVTMEQFLHWAKADVTDLCPPQEWRSAALRPNLDQQPERRTAGERGERG